MGKEHLRELEWATTLGEVGGSGMEEGEELIGNEWLLGGTKTAGKTTGCLQIQNRIGSDRYEMGKEKSVLGCLI